MRTLSVVAAAAVCAALPAQGDPILARLSAETTNVLVVRDPLPVLEKVLASPVVGQFLAGTSDLTREAFGRAFDAPTLRRQLAVLAPMIPTEIVVAAPTRTLDRLSHAAPLFVCHSALELLVRSGQGDGELARSIRASAAAELQQFVGTPLQAWVKVRDERIAESWFDSLSEGLRTRSATLGLEVKAESDRIELRVRPFAPGSPLRTALESVGIDTSSAPAWELTGTVEQVGAELRLQLGEFSPPPCVAARLGPVFGTPDALLFARTEVGDAAASLTEAYLHVAGLAEVDLDESGARLMVRLVELLGRVDAITENQSAVLHVDRGLVWKHETYHSFPAAGDGAPSTLLALASPGEGPLFLTTDTFDVTLANALRKLAGAELSATAPGGPLLDFLESDESAVFAPGVLVVARSAAMRGMKDRTQAPLPFAALAVVARPRSRADGEAFLRELSRKVPGVGAGEEIWAPRDLGLGVEAQVLRLDAVAPALEQKQIDWDFAPHWFVTDDLLVLSTDPALSKDLLARAAAPAAARAPAENTLAWFHLRGETCTDYLTALKQWAPLVNELRGNPPDAGVGTFEALRAAFAHVDFVEFLAEVDGNTLRDRWTLRLREPK